MFYKNKLVLTLRMNGGLEGGGTPIAGHYLFRMGRIEKGAGKEKKNQEIC